MTGFNCALTSGEHPNVYCQAVDLAELRRHPLFDALPPADAICVAGAPSYRYVRQSDPLWDQLHAGMLTTGHLAAALGFYEPAAAAARCLGLPQKWASHGPMLAAYHALCQPSFQPECDPGVAQHAAEAANAAATADYNASLSTCAAPLDAALSNHPNGSGKKTKRRSRHRKHGSSTAPCAALPPLPPPAPLISEPSVAVTTETAKLGAARRLGAAGLESLCCAWGKVQEAASLLALVQAFPGSRLQEVGLCAFAAALPPEWGFTADSLPPLGASPDAFIRHPRRVGNSIDPLESALAGLDLAGAGAQPALERGDALERVPGLGLDFEIDFEVVEVKNTCPFGLSRQRRRGGRARYVLSDRGPRAAVEPRWVPQLQLHMLCAGAGSALLASRSATRGMRVFRMQRDDGYLQLMLGVVRRLWLEHVQPRRPPPRDAFARLPEHQALLRRTRELAAGAALVLEIETALLEGGGAAGGVDRRLFLDTA